MQSIAKNFVAHTAPYNRQVKFQIINGTNTVTGQIASIEAILPEHPATIVIRFELAHCTYPRAQPSHCPGRIRRLVRHPA